MREHESNGEFKQKKQKNDEASSDQGRHVLLILIYILPLRALVSLLLSFPLSEWKYPRDYSYFQICVRMLSSHLKRTLFHRSPLLLFMEYIYKYIYLSIARSSSHIHFHSELINKMNSERTAGKTKRANQSSLSKKYPRTTRSSEIFACSGSSHPTRALLYSRPSSRCGRRGASAHAPRRTGIALWKTCLRLWMANFARWVEQYWQEMKCLWEWVRG